MQTVRISWHQRRKFPDPVVDHIGIGIVENTVCIELARRHAVQIYCKPLSSVIVEDPFPWQTRITGCENHKNTAIRLKEVSLRSPPGKYLRKEPRGHRIACIAPWCSKCYRPIVRNLVQIGDTTNKVLHYELK